MTWFARILTIVTLSSALTGCGGGSESPDFTFIDAYLTTWDRFARGANELQPQLKLETPRFQEQLAKALVQGDRRAPSRVVFYAVVQVGGFIAYNSELGQACEQLVGRELSTSTSPQGARSYFAGDLYFWWEKHATEFDSFPLYEEWRQRDFAKQTVIPMYLSASKAK